MINNYIVNIIIRNHWESIPYHKKTNDFDILDFQIEEPIKENCKYLQMFVKGSNGHCLYSDTIPCLLQLAAPLRL